MVLGFDFQDLFLKDHGVLVAAPVVVEFGIHRFQFVLEAVHLAPSVVQFSLQLRQILLL